MESAISARSPDFLNKNIVFTNQNRVLGVLIAIRVSFLGLPRAISWVITICVYMLTHTFASVCVSRCIYVYLKP